MIFMSHYLPMERRGPLENLNTGDSIPAVWIGSFSLKGSLAQQQPSLLMAMEIDWFLL